MAFDPKITQSVAQSLLTAFETAANAGAAANIRGLTTAIPTNADDAETGTLLFELLCNASIFTSKTDGAPGAVGTFAAITQDSLANASGTLAYFRITDAVGATVPVFQGLAGTSASDMIINTTSITVNSVVAATGTNTITVPEYV